MSFSVFDMFLLLLLEQLIIANNKVKIVILTWLNNFILLGFNFLLVWLFGFTQFFQVVSSLHFYFQLNYIFTRYYQIYPLVVLLSVGFRFFVVSLTCP